MLTSVTRDLEVAIKFIENEHVFQVSHEPQFVDFDITLFSKIPMITILHHFKIKY